MGKGKTSYVPEMDRTFKVGDEIMEFIPHVVDAYYLKDYSIRLKFNDGTLRIVDLEPYIERGGVFEDLKDKDFFKKFFIDLNTLCWPNGADIAPERLYEIGRPVEKHKEGLTRARSVSL